MKSPLRILVVTTAYPSPDRPALGSFVEIQVESLRSLGHTVRVLHLTEGSGLSKYRHGLRELRRALREEEFDLVHGFYVYSGLLGLFQRRVPTVVTYLGTEAYGSVDSRGRTTRSGKLVAWLSRRVLPWFDRVIVQSVGMRRALSAPHLTVLPFGIDFDLFHPVARDECRERLGLDPGKKLLLFANNKKLAVKRYPFAEKAISLVDPTLRAEILTLWNKVPSEDMRLFYGAADALILTSAYEGSPTVVKEALACDTPVVSVDVGDVAENVTGVANCRVTPDDPSAFARALEEVLHSGERSDGRAKSIHLSAPAIAERLVAIYREVLAQR